MPRRLDDAARLAACLGFDGVTVRLGHKSMDACGSKHAVLNVSNQRRAFMRSGGCWWVCVHRMGNARGPVSPHEAMQEHVKLLWQPCMYAAPCQEGWRSQGSVQLGM